MINVLHGLQFNILCHMCHLRTHSHTDGTAIRGNLALSRSRHKIIIMNRKLRSEHHPFSCENEIIHSLSVILITGLEYYYSLHTWGASILLIKMLFSLNPVMKVVNFHYLVAPLCCTGSDVVSVSGSGEHFESALTGYIPGKSCKLAEDILTFIETNCTHCCWVLKSLCLI